MRRFKTPMLFLSLLFSYTLTIGQTKSTGPVIVHFGEVFKVDHPDFKVDSTKEYKAVFDIMESPETHLEINPSIETAARFLNMHTQSGVPVSQLKVALVFHNKASKDVMNDEAYQKRYGTINPNQELIKALLDAGGQIIFCGQSANARGIPKEAIIDGVQLSLSAMTALIQLQDEQYRLIKF